MIFELVSDFAAVLDAMPAAHPRRRILALLDAAVRRDVHFIDRHPTTLFQCLWNSCWWYDSPRSAEHYELPAEDGTTASPDSAPKMSALLMEWRTKSRTGFPWLRSLRPPLVYLEGHQRAIFRGHEWGEVQCVACSADGRRIASANRHELIVWDGATGQRVASVKEPALRSVSFSPDGQRIVTVSNDVCIWGTSDARLLARFEYTGPLTVLSTGSRGPAGPIHRYEVAAHVSAATYAPGGQSIAVAFSDGSVWLIEPERGEVLSRLVGQGGEVKRIACSPDGGRVAVAVYGGVQVWDRHNGAAIACLRGHDGTVEGVAFLGDGRLISAGSDKTARVWDAERGQEVACFQVGEWVHDMAVSPDGKLCVCACGDHTVRVWDVDRGVELACLRGHEDWVQCIAFTPDGRRIVSGSADETVRIWDADASGPEVRTPQHDFQINRIMHTADGSHVISVDVYHTVMVWDVSDGRLVGSIPRMEGLECADCSPDGRLVAVGLRDRTVRLWDVVRGVELPGFQGHGDFVSAVAFPPNGRTVASAGRLDQTVWIWEASSGRPLVRLVGHESAVMCVAFSPGGDRVATGGWDKTIRVWSASTGHQLAVYRFGDSVARVTYSGDGLRLIAHLGSTGKVLDSSSGSCIASVACPDFDCLSVALADPAAWRAVRRGPEMAIVSVANDSVIAWFPAVLDRPAAAPVRVLWAGAPRSHGHLYLFELEGAGTWSPALMENAVATIQVPPPVPVEPIHAAPFEEVANSAHLLARPSEPPTAPGAPTQRPAPHPPSDYADEPPVWGALGALHGLTLLACWGVSLIQSVGWSIAATLALILLILSFVLAYLMVSDSRKDSPHSLARWVNFLLWAAPCVWGWLLWWLGQTGLAMPITGTVLFAGVFTFAYIEGEDLWRK